MRHDIDDALRGWPFDPEPGDIAAREVRARDGRKVVQIRIELGLLQMEVEGRPDGNRPWGFDTYLDYLRTRAASKSKVRKGKGKGKAKPWEMSAEQCVEADREFIQFYHRRIAWLSLQRYDRAVRDADHTLALMDFIAQHAPSAEYIAQHERFRGIVLFHRTQAAAAMALENEGPEEAVDAIHQGIDQLEEHQRDWDDEHQPILMTEAPFADAPQLPDIPLIEQLRQLETEIRRNFDVGKTLREQLDEAVEHEDYERAARIRDRIRDRDKD